jgi:putative FmdB family regulatory protein
MPFYTVFCQKCGAEREVFCPVAERNNKKCPVCGSKMKVQITTAYFVSRGMNFRASKWVRERGL